jgi:hypothetical protein
MQSGHSLSISVHHGLSKHPHRKDDVTGTIEHLTALATETTKSFQVWLTGKTRTIRRMGKNGDLGARMVIASRWDL